MTRKRCLTRRCNSSIPPARLLMRPQVPTTPWINFKNFAITPAVREVSDLSDFTVTIEPLKGKGKQFSRVRLSEVVPGNRTGV